MFRTYRWTMLAAGAALLLAACGSSGGGGGGGAGNGAPGFYIAIQGMAFSPLQLAVPPGGTVTVLNRDGAMPHSVTSEAAQGDFTPGAVGGVQFDTGAFTGQAVFTVPANATDGTVIPYYCTVHKGTMVTPNGSILVDSTAQPALPPGSGGGNGGGY